MKNEISVVFRILFVIVGWISSLLMIISYAGNDSIQSFNYGFAVDSNQNIYVGNPKSISVYSPDGVELRRIPIYIEKTWFSIDNDRIIVYNNGYEIYDLDGNFINEIDMFSQEAREFDIPSVHPNYSFTAEGINYVLRSSFGFKRICKVQGDDLIPIVETSLHSYLIVVGLACLTIIGLLCAFSLYWQIVNEEKMSRLKKKAPHVK